MITELTRAIEQMLAYQIVLKEIEVDDRTYDQLAFEFSQREAMVRMTPFDDPRMRKFKPFEVLQIHGISIVPTSRRIVNEPL